MLLRSPQAKVGLPVVSVGQPRAAVRERGRAEALLRRELAEGWAARGRRRHPIGQSGAGALPVAANGLEARAGGGGRRPLSACSAEVVVGQLGRRRGGPAGARLSTGALRRLRGLRLGSRKVAQPSLEPG